MQNDSINSNIPAGALAGAASSTGGAGSAAQGGADPELVRKFREQLDQGASKGSGDPMEEGAGPSGKGGEGRGMDGKSAVGARSALSQPEGCLGGEMKPGSRELGEPGRWQESFEGREPMKKESSRQDSLSDVFSSLMRGMDWQGAQVQAPAPEAQGMEARPAGGDDIRQMASEMVKRVLVSQPAPGQGSEVRLELGGMEMLRDAGVIIRREPGGMLFVAISTSDQATYQRLVSARSMLEQGLSESERGRFKLEFRLKGEDGSERTDQGADGDEGAF
ncbi:MAG: hypothetical protein PUI29_07260 [Aeromonadales bacterium]|nr:hypothetical protein [Aeromonadales bacterium]MDY2890277.1 hypothetical protein [Succinivibrio sp.]